MKSPDRGFTLIELVIGITLLALALSSVLGLLLNQSSRSVDPVQHARASQLAQRLLGQIGQKSFDERSDHNGGQLRCGEEVAGQPFPPGHSGHCSAQGDYGPDLNENEPAQFNDVDDFDTGGNWRDANWFTQYLGNINAAEYRGYQLMIAVTGVDLTATPPASCASPCAIGKQVALTVRLPDQSTLEFALWRGNY